MRVGVGGVLVSAPLLAIFGNIPGLGIAGAFAMNLTMPVTLMAILNVIPTNRGLSFGLASVALFVGALPAILGRELWLKNEWVLLLLILSASIILFTTLYLTNKKRYGL